MARPATVKRVYDAVLELAERGGPGALTMEGIATEAGVGKQTLYRSWPSVHAILFDALARESEATQLPTAGLSVVDLLRASAEEIATEPRASLLRALAAAIQVDEVVASQFRERLLEFQLDQVTNFLVGLGYRATRQSTELLLAPIFYRWFFRLPALTDEELRDHADRTLNADPVTLVN